MTTNTDIQGWLPIAQAVGPATATFLIGVLVALIAWRQYEVARQKLALDLFDKRYAVLSEFDGQMTVLFEASGNLVVVNVRTAADDIRDRARFLFGDDVISIMDDVIEQSPHLYEAIGDYRGQVAGGYEEDTRSKEIMDRYMAARKKLTVAALRYMRFNRPI